MFLNLCPFFLYCFVVFFIIITHTSPLLVSFLPSLFISAFSSSLLLPSFLHFIHSSFSPYLFLFLPPPFLLSSLSSFIFPPYLLFFLPPFLLTKYLVILNKLIYLFSYHRLLTSSTHCNNI